tara:strand:+ start:1661 stop:1771 length:111 start_codon:yes stop_codon:yes gene_type:complete
MAHRLFSNAKRYVGLPAFDQFALPRKPLIETDRGSA